MTIIMSLNIVLLRSLNIAEQLAIVIHDTYEVDIPAVRV